MKTLNETSIKVIIPAFNEEGSIAKVIADIPEQVDEVVVCNNNSTDQTKLRAEEAGATVVDQPIAGYGNACLKGIAYIKGQDRHPDRPTRPRSNAWGRSADAARPVPWG